MAFSRRRPEMSTMNETKKRLEEASKLERIKITKGGKDKILIDLNGDGEPEAALIDTTNSGRTDLLAIDLTGDHKFNLYMDDTNDNSYPDVFYVDSKGDGNIQLLGIGEERAMNEMGQRLTKIYQSLTDAEAGAEKINEALHDLADAVKKIKTEHIMK